MKELILGGVRSGKSRLAEQRAELASSQVVYIATSAVLDDDSFNQRIAKHRSRRPQAWLTVEEPLYLARVLEQHDGNDTCLLVDCITLWVTNLLCHDDGELVEQQIQDLLNVIPKLRATLIMVSNESGLGVTPMGQLSRDYLDTVGELHQQLAALSDRVTMTIAGLPLALKG